MIRWVAGALSVLLASGVLPAQAFKRTEVGESLKDFTLEAGDGSRFHLEEGRGAGATLVVFWATWSSRSADALAGFQQLYAEHGGRGLQVVAVNVEHQESDPADRPRLEAFARDLGVSFPVVFDQGLAVFNEYGVIAVPSTVLADGQGKIVELLEGYAYTTRDEFRDRVLEVLGVLAPKPEVAGPTGYVAKGKAARYVQMGGVLMERGMPGRAEGVFRQAATQDPDYAAAMRGLAAALRAQGKEGDAEEADRAATEIEGKDPSQRDTGPSRPAAAGGAGATGDAAAAGRYLRMGKLLLGQNQAPAAESAFRKAVEAAPGSADARLALAEALEAQGRPDEAAQERARAAALGPTGKP